MAALEQSSAAVLAARGEKPFRVGDAPASKAFEVSLQPGQVSRSWDAASHQSLQLGAYCTAHCTALDLTDACVRSCRCAPWPSS